MADDFWPVVHSERRALAADLADLSEEQWAVPSLCTGWNIHQVLAHQVSTAKTTPLGFLLRFASAGFNFTKFSDRGVAKESAGGPAATLAAYRAIESSTVARPGRRTPGSARPSCTPRTSGDRSGSPTTTRSRRSPG